MGGTGHATELVKVYGKIYEIPVRFRNRKKPKNEDKNQDNDCSPPDEPDKFDINRGRDDPDSGAGSTGMGVAY